MKKYFLWILYRLWTSTWRVQLLNSSGPLSHGDFLDKVYIFAHWHGHEYGMTQLVGRFRVATMTSRSRDGELINFVIRRLGGVTSRGSASRGAVGGFKGLIRLCRLGHNASLAVDGPRGPIYRVKGGVIELARLLEAPIVPVGLAARPAFIFKKSWNQAVMPLPFAKVYIFFGMPIKPPKDRIQSKSLNISIEKEIHKATEEAAQRISM